jgi:hypothetical protein
MRRRTGKRSMRAYLSAQLPPGARREGRMPNPSSTDGYWSIGKLSSFFFLASIHTIAIWEMMLTSVSSQLSHTALLLFRFELYRSASLLLSSLIYFTYRLYFTDFINNIAIFSAICAHLWGWFCLLRLGFLSRLASWITFGYRR